MKKHISDRWEYDPDRAAHVARFFPGFLQHVKAHSGPFVLQPWQQHLVEQLFGWYDKETGLRRYRNCYVEVPRKQGKTTLAAGILLWMLLLDGERGPEVFSAATTREQAGLVYDIAANMVSAEPRLAKRCKRLDSKKRLVGGGGFFQACSSEAGAIHGTNPHCVIFDELHEQPDRKLWDSFVTGFGARSQPLFFSITTAGYDRSSICWEMHEYSLAVQNDPTIDEQFLPMVFAADPQDDWTDEQTWARANPSLGASVQLDFLRAECARAQEIPAYENTFRRLHLNQWTEQQTRVVPMQEWDKCQKDFEPDDLYGRDAFCGLDLSSTRDVTSLCLVFPDDDGGVTVLPHFWIPERAVDQRTGQDQRMLRNFAASGGIRMTSGNEIDVLQLKDDILAICEDYEIHYIGYDPWNGATVTQLLREEGIPEHCFRKMPQSFGTYNEPMKMLLSWLAGLTFRHNGNVILRWMAGNMAAREDPSGNLRPDKGASGEKIDGMTAMLMGMALAITLGDAGSAYTKPGDGVILI